MKTISEKTSELKARATELAESFINGNLTYVANEILRSRSKAAAAYMALKVADQLPADDVPRLRKLILNRINL